MAAAVGVIVGWIGVAVNAYSLYQYLFSNESSKKAAYKYSDGSLGTRIDNNACIPIIYGKVKSAGNLVFSKMSGNKEILYKMISFCEGRIAGIDDIRFNDLAYGYFENTGVRTYLGTSTQPIDSIIPGSPIAQARVVGGMKNEAYLVGWAKASEELGGDFNVTAIIQGKIIRIYSRYAISGWSYDSALGLYYTNSWSDNPIWCILDFLTSSSGAGIPYSELDVDSFIDAAAYCDQAPLTGGQNKRFKLNIRIDEKRPKLEWVKEMMMTCQAYPTYQNGKFGVMIEQPREVSQVFKPQHINDLNIWWSTSNEIADVARIGYVEPGQEWVKIYASAEAEKPLREPPYVKELDILGVTNFNQASRLAWFYLNQSTTCTMYISFKTDRRALNRSVGEVIEIQDEYITSLTEFNRAGKRFSIYQIAETPEGQIEIYAREYNQYLYGDLVGSAPPVINISNLPNPFTTPPDILGFSVLNQVYYVQKDKTAVSYIDATAILPEYPYFYQLRYFYSVDDGTWTEVGTSVSGQMRISNAKVGSTYRLKVQLENTYGIRSVGYISDPILITGKNEPPAIPTNFTATETIGGFNLSWNANADPDIDGYNIYEGKSADVTYLISNNYAGTNYTYSATRTGRFTFHVCAVDTSGNMSPPASVTTYIIPPEAVSDFDVCQNGRDLDFRWTQNENERLRVGYEIRRGESWDLGELIGRVNGNSYKISFYSTAHSHKFWIKAISTYGVYSENASYATIDIAAMENRNVILKHTPTDTKPEGAWGEGSRINLEVVDGGLMLENGALNGEQIYKIALPESYSSRNWVDSAITAVQSNFLTWEQATFTWDSPEAQSMWLPAGQTKNAYIAHQFSRKTTVASSVIESIPLNSSITPEFASTIDSQIKVEYADGRFFDGFQVQDSAYLSWNVNIPEVFSHHFHAHLTKGLAYDSTFAVLSGSGGKLVIGYRFDTDSFYLQDSIGNIQTMHVKFSTNDYITFAISQGATKRKFFVSSFSAGISKVSYDEQTYSPIGVFTKYSLYGTI